MTLRQGTYRLLRDQSDVFAVFAYVVARDWPLIEVDSAMQRVIEALNELNSAKSSVPGATARG